MLTPPPLTSEFVGMVGYAPAFCHDLMDEDVRAMAPASGDVVAEYAMVDALGQPLVVAESLSTHTPLDPRADALACA